LVSDDSFVEVTSAEIESIYEVKVDKKDNYTELDFLDQSYLGSQEPLKWYKTFESNEAEFDIKSAKHRSTYERLSENVFKRRLQSGNRRIIWSLLVNLQKN
jgi:hypothetical protein